MNIKTDIVKVNSGDGEVVLNNQIVRDMIAVGYNITDQEIYNFMMLCKYRGLNPFVRDAYIVKYGDSAQLITGKDVFLKRLHANKLCTGWQAGVIVQGEDKKVIERKGTFFLPEERLVGAYMRINREGWKENFEWTISLNDYCRTYYNKKTQKQELMPNWKAMPAVMLVKCVIVAGIRNLFPDEISGLYSEEEMGVESSVIEIKDYQVSEEFITKNKITQLVMAAKSKKVDSYKPDELLKYAMKSLVEKGVLISESKKEIPVSKFDGVLDYVKKLVKKKEDQAEKDQGQKEEKPGQEDPKTDQEKEKPGQEDPEVGQAENKKPEGSENKKPEGSKNKKPEKEKNEKDKKIEEIEDNPFLDDQEKFDAMQEIEEQDKLNYQENVTME